MNAQARLTNILKYLWFVFRATYTIIQEKSEINLPEEEIHYFYAIPVNEIQEERRCMRSLNL